MKVSHGYVYVELAFLSQLPEQVLVEVEPEPLLLDLPDLETTLVFVRLELRVTTDKVVPLLCEELCLLAWLEDKHRGADPSNPYLMRPHKSHGLSMTRTDLSVESPEPVKIV